MLIKIHYRNDILNWTKRPKSGGRVALSVMVKFACRFPNCHDFRFPPYESDRNFHIFSVDVGLGDKYLVRYNISENHKSAG